MKINDTEKILDVYVYVCVYVCVCVCVCVYIYIYEGITITFFETAYELLSMYADFYVCRCLHV